MDEINNGENLTFLSRRFFKYQTDTQKKCQQKKPITRYRMQQKKLRR